MKLATKLKTALTAFGAVTLLGACENFEFLHEKELKEQGFTQEQAEVGAAEGLRKLFSEEEELESGKTSYKLQYGGISDEDVLFTVKSIRIDLEKMLKLYDRKYHLLSSNLFTIIKAVGYFDEAETSEMPKMIHPAPWQQVKNFLSQESLRLACKYLD